MECKLTRWQWVLLFFFSISLLFFFLENKLELEQKSLFVQTLFLKKITNFSSTSITKESLPLNTPDNFVRKTPHFTAVSTTKLSSTTTKLVPRITSLQITILGTPPLLTTTLQTTTFNQLTTKPPKKCDDYIVFSDTMKDHRGFGNQIFTMVAGLMVAQLTNRTLVMNATILNHTSLEDVFTYRYQRVDIICPKITFNDQWNLAYNPDVENFISSNTSSSIKKLKSIANKTIVLAGFFQSWKYALNENSLRHVYLNMQYRLVQFAQNLFESIRPSEWVPHTYIQVGVHVRRGDVISQHNINFGYTTPNASYFIKAMNKMLLLFKKVHFIVASNDLAWCHANINSNLLSPPLGSITHISFLEGNNASIDFAVLSSCHHTIMSTGTFGWWAAFLTRGTTIYYNNWPKNGTSLASKFKKEDFFLPSWLGMSD